MSYYGLKYEDLKNGDCSLIYPKVNAYSDLKEKRKQIDVVSGPRAIYNSIQIEQI